MILMITKLLILGIDINIVPLLIFRIFKMSRRPIRNSAAAANPSSSNNSPLSNVLPFDLPHSQALSKVILIIIVFNVITIPSRCNLLTYINIESIACNHKNNHHLQPSPYRPPQGGPSRTGACCADARAKIMRRCCESETRNLVL